MELYPFSIQPIKGNNCGLIQPIKGNNCGLIPINMIKRYFIEKYTNLIYNLCFGAVTLVIVLTWFL